MSATGMLRVPQRSAANHSVRSARRWPGEAARWQHRVGAADVCIFGLYWRYNRWYKLKRAEGELSAIAGGAA